MGHRDSLIDQPYRFRLCHQLSHLIYDLRKSENAYNNRTGSIRPALRNACASKPGPLAT